MTKILRIKVGHDVEGGCSDGMKWSGSWKEKDD
jgi:hypothetical protein